MVELIPSVVHQIQSVVRLDHGVLWQVPGVVELIPGVVHQIQSVVRLAHGMI